MDALNKLTTIQEYVQHYYTQAKNELNARGLQVSKVGLIGFILNMMGFTQADIKEYLDTLFIEAFVGTASQTENLNMHGSIFGYITGYATPAKVTGSFTLNLNQIPSTTSSNRTIFIEGLQVIKDSMVFNLDSKYVIVGNVCQITAASGKVTNIPFSSTSPVLPIVDLIQYEQQTATFSAPFYIFGSYYSIIVDLQNTEQMIYTVDVYIKEAGSSDFTQYEVRNVDYYTTSSEAVVFAKQVNSGKLMIDLGSGVHGKYIPNAQVRVIIKSTYGEAGNISQISLTPYNGYFRVYENDTNGESLGSFTVEIGKGITADIDYADGGVDILQGDDLRNDIIKFIRSRNNLMSETDFYDIIGDSVPDFLLMFKKTHVVDNIFYAFLPFRDSYQNPIRSQCISVKHSEFNSTGACYVYRPTFTLNDIEYISPFLYKVDYNMRYYKGYLVYESVSTYFSNVVSNTTSSNKSIPLTLLVRYIPQLDTTEFILQSYESLSSFVFHISIPLLGIYDVCMTSLGSTAFKYSYYDSSEGSGLIFSTIDILVKAFQNGELLYTYEADNFSMVSDISDLLTLKTFEGMVVESELTSFSTTSVAQLFPADAYVLNIPIMRLDEFTNDEDYYLNKFEAAFSIALQTSQRMMSDDVQIRFINTDIIESAILKASTKQAYDFQLRLPLQLVISITAYKTKIAELGVNTTSAENTLKLDLATKLQNTYTGTSVSFYRTQIINIVQDIEWVKHCSVSVYDSVAHEIPDADLEILDQKEIIANLDKLSAVSYTPMYIWWDLDNIIINTTFE